MIAQLGLNTKIPYHFLFWGVAFGGSSFYSFIVSPLVFKKLPREEFSNLQTQVFPTYFSGQIVAPIILGLTSPLKLCPFTTGLLVASSVGGLLNFYWLMPVCRNLKEKKNKLIADKLDTTESGEPTEEYTATIKKFGAYHGLSSLANALSIVSLGFYGVLLAKKLV
ncbi:hypothetical protein G9P44_001222 [Scheffersomyces stipitis]|nr:hypothetical protein G9P44_001222 [Scheffersomyces stipitis]